MPAPRLLASRKTFATEPARRLTAPPPDATSPRTPCSAAAPAPGMDEMPDGADAAPAEPQAIDPARLAAERLIRNALATAAPALREAAVRPGACVILQAPAAGWCGLLLDAWKATVPRDERQGAGPAVPPCRSELHEVIRESADRPRAGGAGAAGADAIREVQEALHTGRGVLAASPEPSAGSGEPPAAAELETGAPRALECGR